MPIQTCPHCQSKVMPSSDGICPSCRKNVDSSGQPAAEPAKPAPEKPAINPYSPPKTDPTSPTSPAPEPVINGKEPFSLQAAKFSLYSPFILLFVGFGLNVVANINENKQLGLAWGAFFALTTIVAFVLGFVGFIGGIKRKSPRSIVYSVLGVLLNGGLILVVVAAIVERIARRQ